MSTLRAPLFIAAVTVLSFAVACSGGSKKPSITAASICAATKGPDVNIASSDIIEASGIAASRLDDNVLWVHNDSGDTARFFAIDRLGRHNATFTLDSPFDGVPAIDWEDMAIGPGPDGNTPYLYLADIGDNAAQRSEIKIYRVPEPQDSLGSDTPTNSTIVQFDTLTLRYPDHPHDAETLLVDPVTGDLLIVTKELSTGVSTVFRAPASIQPDTPTTLEQAGQIDFKSLPSHVTPPPGAPPLVANLGFLPTGGDISPDGSLIAIRTYGNIWVWSRPKDAPVADAFTGSPCEAPSALEQQGEAIAFDRNGAGYVTTSEGASPPLHHFTAR